MCLGRSENSPRVGPHRPLVRHRASWLFVPVSPKPAGPGTSTVPFPDAHFTSGTPELQVCARSSLWLPHGFWGLNSGSHACLQSKSPLFLEPSPQSGFSIENNLKQAKEEAERAVRRSVQSDNEWLRPWCQQSGKGTLLSRESQQDSLMILFWNVRRTRVNGNPGSTS